MYTCIDAYLSVYLSNDIPIKSSISGIRAGAATARRRGAPAPREPGKKQEPRGPWDTFLFDVPCHKTKGVPHGPHYSYVSGPPPYLERDSCRRHFSASSWASRRAWTLLLFY